MKRFTVVLVILMAFFIGMLVNLVAPDKTYIVSRPVSAAQVSRSTEALNQTSRADNVFTQIYDDVSPSVVAIRVTISARNQIIGTATGSGFVIDQQGYIVTNNHVVDGGSQIEVDLFDGTLAWADIVGVDPDSDLAVLKVDVPAEQLHPITFGNSNALQVGQTVLAIGSPFGQDWTLTSGIISGLDRTIQGLNRFSIGGVIQTDAAINPGNSGGPLLNLDGQLIGVNSQIATNTTSNSGVGFAIPSNLAQRVAQQLITQGSAEYSYIGISGTDVTLSLIDALGLPSNTRGVLVSEVMRGGPADSAGLQTAGTVQSVNGQGIPTRFDIITAIDGYPLKGMEDLISYLARETMPDQTAHLTVLRDGKQQIEIDIILSARP